MSSYILKSYFLCLFFCILPLIHPYSCFLSITWLLPATDLLFKSLTLLPGSLLAPGRASSLVSPDLDNVTSAVTDQEVPRLSVLNVPKWISTSWPNKWIICELLGQLDYFMMLLRLPSRHTWSIWSLSVGVYQRGSFFFLCSSVFLLSDARWSVKAW